MNERLYRTVDDRMMLGVLGGIALRLDVDPSVVRVVFVIVWIATGLVPLFVVYIVAGIIIPDAPAGYEAWVRAARTAWGSGAPGGQGSGGPGVPPAGAWQAPPPAAWPAPPAGDPEVADAAGPGIAEGVPAAADPGVGSATPGAGPVPTGPPPAWGSAWDATGRPMTAPPRRESDGRVAAAVGGIVLVGLGVIFLAGQLVPQIDWSLVWPAALIALGVLLVIGSIRRA